MNSESGNGEGLGALIEGTLRYDPENRCFLLDSASNSFPIVWPAGTEAVRDGAGIRLSSGSLAYPGDRITGGGGYLRVADEYGIPAACSPDTDEVAVFNPSETLVVLRNN